MDIGKENATYYAFWVPTPDPIEQAKVTVYGANLPEGGLKLHPSFNQGTWQHYTAKGRKMTPRYFGSTIGRKHIPQAKIHFADAANLAVYWNVFNLESGKVIPAKNSLSLSDH
ncbi:hypothetical protein PROFUN_16083 [Planoprotostelium fungivorum]|uniref:Uncharacterized protein n=1 Tax=Planoprotostelium fungivorum TaxID=1890364 RepID=A0A2P6MXD3_9EUKA|nr:hypothetical protein PROFUN_16083 [Planoprotostelium fungivorum]